MNKDETKKLANEILITLTPEEEAAFASELAYFKKLAALLEVLPNIDETAPMVFPFKVTQTYLREDEAEVSPGAKEILKNSKNVKDTFVVVPKVVK
ncbi:MAG: aspartyl/glutamyl-tRNA amidotransferase subunit C [Tenericutes bacterium ADurb.Bin087]|nr:MAG: aspartyl/glutamyl-tRNA amidotransferase subunit C [Tenericutes bacterium ADurb.Bin087]